jgi:hypothetical protein
MQKKVSNVTSFHPRQQAATITLHSRPRSATISFSAIRRFTKKGRRRVNTIGDSKMPPEIKILLDTDKRAQQYPSILQFALGR